MFFASATNLETISSQVGISDIDYAVRYTQQNESLDFGFLGASESDEAFSQGRDFYSIRLRKAEKKFSIGYLSSIAFWFIYMRS